MKRIIKAFLIVLCTAFFGVLLYQSQAVMAAGISVTYKTHVQNVGWGGLSADGMMSGTEGRGLRLEGLTVEITGNDDLGIRYSTHIQNIGWQEYKSDGVVSGTTNRALRLEAIKIELTGSDAKYFDVYYRVHAQNFGWLGWTKNGFASGTEGYGYRLEAIEIKVVEKGEAGPISKSEPFHSTYGNLLVRYGSHVESVGWQKEAQDGVLSGLVGRSKRMEAFTAALGTVLPSGSITYQAHVQNKGWMSEVSDGRVSGTEGLGLRIEALKIKLTGRVSEVYGIEYRTHVQNIGWMEWKRDGEVSGTTGQALRIEAIEIRLYKKNVVENGKDHAIYSLNTNLWLRSGPSTESTGIVVMAKNTKVKVYEVVNGWAKIDFNGKLGYASRGGMTFSHDVLKEPLPIIVELSGMKESYKKENVVLSGIALGYSGVRELKVFLDGKEITVTRYTDNNAVSAYTNYPNKENSSFKIEIAHESLSEGDHTITVQVESNYRHITTKTISFRMVKNPTILTVEGIVNGASIPTEKVAVTGIALTDSGVKEVRYYVNDILKGNAEIGLPSDGGKYSTYPNSTSGGYRFILDPALLTKDMNTVKVEVISTDSSVEYENMMLQGKGVDTFVFESYPSSLNYYVDKEYVVNQKYSGSGSTVWNKIRYNMDPGNYIYDDVNRYIFMDLSYSPEDFHVDVELLNTMLNNKGILHGMGQVFLDAAIQYRVNPFYLIAHSLLETGNGSSVLANGQKVELIYEKFGDINSPSKPVPEEDRDKLVYNVFGIGAWDVNPNLWGAQKAYLEKWFSVEEAIFGGAKWISTNYVHRAKPQNTLYKMRFNIGDNMTHQYATDIEWARKQAKRIKDQFDALGVTVPKRYIVPTFTK